MKCRRGGGARITLDRRASIEKGVLSAGLLTHRRPWLDLGWDHLRRRRAGGECAFPLSLIAPVAGFALAVLAMYLSKRFVCALVPLLGDTVTTVIQRMTSFILLCICMQILWDMASAACFS